MKDNSILNAGFHNVTTKLKYEAMASTDARQTQFTYTFYNHFHPYVSELLQQLNENSIDGLLDAKILAELGEDFFEALYQPNEDDNTVNFGPPPKKEIDVSEEGAYAVYNWELLFHVPFTIAVHLSKNQRFVDAQRWFHYIFNPTASDGQFWRFLAFREGNSNKQIDQLLYLMSKPDSECSEDEPAEKDNILGSYETWKNNPFQPHAVARTRFLGYQFNVVMKYLDNLIAWGDSLFRQDSIETLNEATQIYVLAANLLGSKPQRIPQRGTIRPKTFAQLRSNGLDPLGNALVELEGHFPFNLYTPTTEGIDTDKAMPLFGIGRTLYFCIPRNDKLLSYWDTVADRLFKIRHCMNIEGVVRQLPLFQPPLDPGMLVKAAAAGIDISSLVSGLSQPLAPVRSILLIQKALEICSEVRGLGGALLAALEKQDAESLGLLRQKHEINIQQLSQDVRFLQCKEAESATESLIKSRESALERYNFYQRMLGSEEQIDSSGFTFERKDLTEDTFNEVYGELVGQFMLDMPLEDYPDFEVKDEGNLFLNKKENAELNEHLPLARDTGLAASIIETIGSAVVFIPDTEGNVQFWGMGGTINIPIGTAISKVIEITARSLRATSAYERDQAALASRTAHFERRVHDWKLQSNLAIHELKQIGRQIISSLLREQITRHEYQNLKKQIEQSQETDQFLREKFTSEALYGWMQGELSKLYYEYYKFAFDIAKKAEQTMKHELMRPELDELHFIKFNYWDGGRKGLLSGEALHLDIKRMEMAYHDHHKREYELTKHVSLRQLDPVALLSLKANASCEVNLPEWLFDLDSPGHYMRRIKNVSITIPAVTGPYTSVNCTLSLLKSTLRKSPLLRDDRYERETDEEDARFVDYYGTIQSIVTSNSQNDSGLFETNLRDERFLPFEGHGAISHWKLELPEKFRLFDYNSISDVILHVRFTSRQGGSLLREKAEEHLKTLIEIADDSGLAQLFSLRHDFPNEWYQFVNSEDDGNFVATIKKEYFPYFVQGEDIDISSIELYAIQDDALLPTTVDGLTLSELTSELQDSSQFELSLAESDVLKRDKDAQVFIVVKYTA